MKDYVPAGLALTTKALGTLLLIMRDNDMLTGKLGKHVYATGAVGELIVNEIITVLLKKRGNLIALASVAMLRELAIAVYAAP